MPRTNYYVQHGCHDCKYSVNVVLFESYTLNCTVDGQLPDRKSAVEKWLNKTDVAESGKCDNWVSQDDGSEM